MPDISTATQTKTKTKTAVIVGIVAVAALGLAAGIALLRSNPSQKICVGGPKAAQGNKCTKDLDCLGGRCQYAALTSPTKPTNPPSRKTCLGGPKAAQGNVCTQDRDCLGGKCR
ncbi:MAG: hypothetical protein WC641_07025 [Patescibacteria group bacterium]